MPYALQYVSDRHSSFFIRLSGDQIDLAFFVRGIFVSSDNIINRKMFINVQCLPSKRGPVQPSCIFQNVIGDPPSVNRLCQINSLDLDQRKQRK